MESYAIVRVGTEEKRLGWPRTFEGWLDVSPQCGNARLCKVPGGLVQFDVELDIGALVKARHTESTTGIIHARIGQRCARNRRPSVRNKRSSQTFGSEARVCSQRVEIHRHFFSCSSRLGNEARLRGNQRLIKIEPRFFQTELRQMFLMMDRRAADDNVAREASIIDKIKRRCWRTMPGDTRNVEWKSLETRRWHYRHGDLRDWNQRGNRSACLDLSIR